jgi:hypothetical protein
VGALSPRRAAQHDVDVPYPLTQFVKEHNTGVLAAVVLEYSRAWAGDAMPRTSQRIVCLEQLVR